MISSWNRFIYRTTVSNRMHMHLYTGGGYRSAFVSPSVFHAFMATNNIRGYVCPVIYNVFFRQHRRMLSFLRVFFKATPRYIAAGDGREAS